MSLAEALTRLFEEVQEGADPPVHAKTAQRILDGAAPVFASVGYDGATTRALAKAAGVAEKTLFAHFEGKAGLFAEVLRPLVMALVAPASLAAFLPILQDPSLTPRDRLRGVLANRLRFVQQHPEGMRLLGVTLLTNETCRQLFLAQWMRTVGAIAQVRLAEAQAQGLLPQVPLQRLGVLLLSLVSGYATYRVLLLPDADGDEVDQVVDLLFDGLG